MIVSDKQNDQTHQQINITTYRYKTKSNAVKRKEIYVLVVLAFVGILNIAAQNVQFNEENDRLIVLNDIFVPIEVNSLPNVQLEYTDSQVILTIGTEMPFYIEQANNYFSIEAEDSDRFNRIAEELLGLTDPRTRLSVTIDSEAVQSFLATYNLKTDYLIHDENIAKNINGLIGRNPYKRTILLNALINLAYDNSVLKGSYQDRLVIYNQKLHVVPDEAFETLNPFLVYDLQNSSSTLMQLMARERIQGLKDSVLSIQSKASLTASETDGWQVIGKEVRSIENLSNIPASNLFAFDKAAYTNAIEELMQRIDQKINPVQEVSTTNPIDPNPRPEWFFWLLLALGLLGIAGILIFYFRGQMPATVEKTATNNNSNTPANKPNNTSSSNIPTTNTTPSLNYSVAQNRSKPLVQPSTSSDYNVVAIGGVHSISSFISQLESNYQQGSVLDVKNLLVTLREIEQNQQQQVGASTDSVAINGLKAEVDNLRRENKIYEAEFGQIESRVQQLAVALDKSEEQNFVPLLSRGLDEALRPVDRDGAIANHINQKLNPMLNQIASDRSSQHFLSSLKAKFEVVQREIDREPDYQVAKDQFLEIYTSLVSEFKQHPNYRTQYQPLIEDLFKKHLTRNLSQIFIKEMDKPVEALHNSLSYAVRNNLNGYDIQKEVTKQIFELAFHLYEIVRFKKFFEAGYKTNNYRPTADKVLEGIQRVSNMPYDKKKVYTGSREESEIVAIVGQLLDGLDAQEFNAFVEGYEIPMRKK